MRLVFFFSLQFIPDHPQQRQTINWERFQKEPSGSIISLNETLSSPVSSWCGLLNTTRSLIPTKKENCECVYSSHCHSFSFFAFFLFHFFVYWLLSVFNVCTECISFLQFCFWRCCSVPNPHVLMVQCVIRAEHPPNSNLMWGKKFHLGTLMSATESKAKALTFGGWSETLDFAPIIATPRKGYEASD